MRRWRARICALAVAVGPGELRLGVVHSAAAGPSTLCRTVDVTTVRRVPIAVRPSYFFKVVPRAGLVAMTTELGNALLDLGTTPARVLPIPGNYDPVPSFPDGDIVSVASGALRFYAFETLQRDGKRARPFHRSRHVLMSGAYQSMARISSAEGWARYRVIVVSDQDGALRSQQIVVRFRGGVPVAVSDQTRPRRLCARLRPDATNLPMLSKSGGEIALFDGRSTKVFRIDNAACTPVLDLGIPTGKVDFSFDDRRLAFHVGITRQATTRTAAQPDLRARLTTWVYDRDAAPDTPALRPVTLSATGNTYYPVFTPDGQVLYLHAQGAEQAPDYSFVYATPPAVNAASAGGTEARAATALGRLWRSVCTDGHQAARALAPQAIPPHLDPDACRRLVAAKWPRDGRIEDRAPPGREPDRPPGGAALAGLDAADLLGACPRPAPSASATR